MPVATSETDRMLMLVRYRSEQKGAHVHMRVFMGVDADHLQLTGTLVMDLGQWQLFGAALMLGADCTSGALVVESPDGEAMARNWFDNEDMP